MNGLLTSDPSKCFYSLPSSSGGRDQLTGASCSLGETYSDNVLSYLGGGQYLGVRDQTNNLCAVGVITPPSEFESRCSRILAVTKVLNQKKRRSRQKDANAIHASLKC